MNRPAISGAALAYSDLTEAGLEVPSGRGFIALLEAFRATGGTAPGEILGRLLAEYQFGHTVSLAKLIYSGQVFSFEWRSSLWIPMFQFEARDLTLCSGAQQVRTNLPSMWSGWNIASWFASANAQLNASRPVDLLATDFQAVMRAASLLASVDHYAHDVA